MCHQAVLLLIVTAHTLFRESEIGYPLLIYLCALLFSQIETGFVFALDACKRYTTKFCQIQSGFNVRMHRDQTIQSYTGIS